MTFTLILKLVVKNLNAMKREMIPFIISVSIMFGLQYIMISLIGNDYIQERHSTLPTVMIFSNVITSILTMIFIIYANRFLMKQRQQEFGLNMILGMEKKHLRMILFFETVIQYIIVAAISIIGGFLFGSLMFMALNRFVQNTGITLMEYPFDITAAGITLVMLFGIMLVLFIINNIKISLQNPIGLLQSQKAGEKKTSKIMLLLYFVTGSAALASGYFLAFTTEGVISSLQTIFIAGLLVLAGTYLLFMSMIILILNLLKSIPGYYYKPNHFLSISGMLYRMRANAVSLASIAMLVTLLSVTMGMTTTAYRGIEHQIDSTVNHDYSISINDYSEEPGEELQKVQSITTEIDALAETDNFRVSETTFVPAYNDDGNIEPMTDPENQNDTDKATYVYFNTIDGHNAINDENLSLGENEVGLSANAERFSEYDNITLPGNTFDTVLLEEDYIGAQVAIDTMYIVVQDLGELEQMAQNFQSTDMDTGEYEPSEIYTNLAFNVENTSEQLGQSLTDIASEYDVNVTSRENVSDTLYELNGGLIFIGMIVSIVLLIGTFLILYYKQISEGQEDRKNFQIMKKVGLPDHLIRKTIRTQILWIFILPVIAAIIHTLFAFNIIFQLLGLIGVRDEMLFMTSYLGVLIIILAVYGLMYLITSRIYYNIINE